MSFFESMNYYAALKVLEEEREARRRAVKERHAAELAALNGDYPDLDDQLRKSREDIQAEVTAVGGAYETPYGKAEIQFRPSWVIVNDIALAHWLSSQDKDELYSYTFKKAEINKICTGLELANYELPAGIEKVNTPTLVITLNDTQRQAV